MYREVDPNKFTKTPIKSIGGSNENVFVFNVGNDHLQDPGTILSGKALE